MHACDACLGPSVDAMPNELQDRPLMARLLSRRPIVVRSAAGVTVVSVSRLRYDTQTADATGHIISRRRLDPAIARAYLDARRARDTTKPPITS